MKKTEKRFFNRELSWLRFNTRVLNEANNKKIPLFERLKFIAIYGTNLRQESNSLRFVVISTRKRTD